MLARSAIAIGLLLLVGGCTHDPLVKAEVYPGLVRVEVPAGELTPVLFMADDTPARQGFLFVAMYEAGVAGQNASLAHGATRLAEARTRVGEVLYAIDPALAPPWSAKDTGFAEVWAGSGYGLRRAGHRMIEEITAALESGTASAALRTYGPQAIRCVENTLARADQTAALGQRVLAAPADADLDPTLRQLDEVATALNNGVPSPDNEGCGLKQAFRYLSEIGPYAADGSWGV